jgi:hypothetical protein
MASGATFYIYRSRFQPEFATPHKYAVKKFFDLKENLSLEKAQLVLGIVDVNSKFIEVAIALSVLFTALNNIFSFLKTKIWMLAFGFGLIHGFGFANVLKEMVLTTKELVGSLLGFNLGVEIGQLAIVVVVVPLLYLSRKSLFYKYVVLYTFSAITAVVAFLWAYERYFNLSILPF